MDLLPSWNLARVCELCCHPSNSPHATKMA
jgi:hypothetical protein